MVDLQLSDDRETMAEMEEFVREIATEVGVEPEGLRAKLNILFERKAVSPRRGSDETITLRSKNSETALMIAVKYEHVEVVHTRSRSGK